MYKVLIAKLLDFSLILYFMFRKIIFQTYFVFVQCFANFTTKIQTEIPAAAIMTMYFQSGNPKKNSYTLNKLYISF